MHGLAVHAVRTAPARIQANTGVDPVYEFLDDFMKGDRAAPRTA